MQYVARRIRERDPFTGTSDDIKVEGTKVATHLEGDKCILG
jgi:hypothetical protein